jgi:hypothetical protein
MVGFEVVEGYILFTLFGIETNTEPRTFTVPPNTHVHFHLAGIGALSRMAAFVWVAVAGDHSCDSVSTQSSAEPYFAVVTGGMR